MTGNQELINEGKAASALTPAAVAEEEMGIKPSTSAQFTPENVSSTTLRASSKPKLPKHREMANTLLAEDAACFIEGIPAIRNENAYEMGWSVVEQALQKHYRNSTQQQRSEAMATIRLEAPKKNQAPPHYIAFSNGVLNVESLKFVSGIEEPVPNIIPHRWNPEACSELVDGFLSNLADGNAATKANLEEAAGLCMYRSNEYPFIFILDGRGSNGKSLYMSVIEYMLGSENVTGIHPDELAGRFQAEQIIGKLAILADDASSSTITETTCSTMKRLSGSGLMHTDIKGKPGIDFRPYATLLISYNSYPLIKNNDYGFMRRIVPIEFTKTFTDNTPGYDPHLAQKLKTKNAAEALIVRAIAGLRRILKTSKPTTNELSEAKKEEIRLENDSIAAWMCSEDVSMTDIVGHVNKDVYAAYIQWCKDSGMPQKNSNIFSREVCRKFNVTTINTRAPDRTQFRKYVLK